MEEMTFWDHLDELRKVIFRVLAVAVLASVGLFIVMPTFFDTVILAPCYGDFPIYSLFCYVGNLIGMSTDFCNPDFKISLINIQLTSQFLIHIRSSFMIATLVVFPYILFEIWNFVRPALYDKEKKSISIAFLLGAMLFYTGMAVSYFIIFPMTLRFLAGYQLSDHIVNQLSLDSYISTFVSMNLAMGIIFEMPMLALLLSKLGLITRSFFKKWRKHAIVILVFIAAVITPTGDPFTLTLVALPLYMLWELSGMIVRKEE